METINHDEFGGGGKNLKLGDFTPQPVDPSVDSYDISEFRRLGKSIGGYPLGFKTLGDFALNTRTTGLN